MLKVVVILINLSAVIHFLFVYICSFNDEISLTFCGMYIVKLYVVTIIPYLYYPLYTFVFVIVADDIYV